MSVELPAFQSALSYTQVRDFAYHSSHPLHYGVPMKEEDQPPANPIIFEQTDDSPAKNRPDDIYRRAVALFDFEPENDNEIRLVEGQVVWISYRHGQGWLVAENLESGMTGLVPEEYVQVQPDDENEWLDEPQ